MIFFLVVYLFEATFRKYVFATPLIILVKYFPLLVYFTKSLFGSNLLYVFALYLPLLGLITSFSSLQFAAYDFLVIAIVPILIIMITRESLSLHKKIKILYICVFGGLANSLMIIAQFFVGPTHFLSQTVDQQFSQHTYLADLYQKAPGIAANSSSSITTAGLIASISLYNHPKAPRKFLNLSILLNILSVVFNLPSRSYVLGVALFLSIYLILSISRNASYGRLLRLLSVALPLGLVYNHFIQNQDFNDANRLNDFDSVISRIPQFFPIEQLDMLLPAIGGAGLGSTVNNNPFFNPDIFPQCQSYLVEYEFTRYICSFGYYGYIMIASRFFLASLLIAKSLTLVRSGLILRASGLIYISLQFLLSASFKINDVSAGLLLIAIASIASIESLDIWKKEILF